MKTLKLFWENPYLKETKANILSIKPYEEDPTKFVAVLDKSIFYPEGGGQPWDEGKIGDSSVLYVYEKDEIIYHVINDAPVEKIDVLCSIDWERRFDFMQQHLGQHILSYSFAKLYDADTVGFHLGEEIVTIDINKSSLESIEMEIVEKDANDIIYKNLEVKTLFPTEEEVLKLPLRKPPTVEEDIRIVEIHQLDFSPCGGIHPQNTGAVGIIKIRKWEKNKGNLRVEFVCGKRAIKDFHWKNRQINSIANMLSVKDNEVQDAVTKMHEKTKELNKNIKNYKKILMDYQVKELYNNAEKMQNYFLVVKEFNGEDFKDIRAIASSLSEHPNTICLLGTKTDKAQVIFSCSKEVPVNMNQLFKEVIPLIDGKGGGNSTSAQGGGNDINNLGSLLQAAKQKIEMEYIK